MENQAKIYQALLDGKTIQNKKTKLKLALNSHSNLNFNDCFEHPEDWEIYNEFKMEPAEWTITDQGKVRYDEFVISDIQKFGMKYHTEELAEKARDEMREANLLRYWASVIDPEWKADWNNYRQYRYYVYYDFRLNKYLKSWNDGFKRLGLVYMSEKTAKKICDALNKGELELS